MLKNYKISKAFTFAELMISLAIIAIITVVLYPTIADLAPNNNAYLFKSTYKTIETIVSEISTTSEIPYFVSAADSNVGSQAIATACFCHEFADRLNLTGGITAGGITTGCASTSPNVCPNGQSYTNEAGGNNTFTTTNGVRWAFQYNSTTNPHTIEILVDVNASNNLLNPSENNINIIGTNPQPSGWNNDMSDIWLDPRLGNALTARGIYYTTVQGTQDTFLIRVNLNGNTAGKISIASAIGYNHLQEKNQLVQNKNN